MSTHNFSQVVCAKCDKPADHMLLCSNPECVGYRQQVSMPKWAWDELTSLRLQLSRALEDAERAKKQNADASVNGAGGKYLEDLRNERDALLADKARLDTIKRYVGNIDYWLKPVPGTMASGPFIATGHNFRSACDDLKRQMDALLDLRSEGHTEAIDASRPGASGGGTAG